LETVKGEVENLEIDVPSNLFRERIAELLRGAKRKRVSAFMCGQKWVNDEVKVNLGAAGRLILLIREGHMQMKLQFPGVGFFGLSEL